MRPQKNYQGTTFSDQPSLDQADQQFRKQYPFMDSAQNNMSVPDRFAYYAGNPQAGQSELDRVNTKLNFLQGIGDQSGINSANTYKSNLMQVLGQNPNLTPQQQQYNTNQNQINDTIGYLSNFARNPQPFDVYSSPQYQAALSNANYNTQQNVRQAQEALGTAGIGRSSALQDEAQRLGNVQQQYLMNSVVPQIIQQHQEQQQQQYNNGLSALNALMQNNQQQFQNQVSSAGLTGQFNGQPTMQGEQSQAALTGMLPNGTPTYAAQQQAIQNAINRASAFGTVTNPEDAQLLGVPLGTSTRELQALLYKNQYQNAMLGLKQQANQIASVRAGNQATRDQAMSNYYNARSSDVKNTQDANNITSEVYNHAQDFQSPQDVEDYFKANGSYLAQHLGAKATNDLKNSFLAPFQQDNKQSSSIYDRAFAAAQRDGDWPSLSSDEKNARISQYQQMLQNQGAGNQ
jgi:hypothetical protein